MDQKFKMQDQKKFNGRRIIILFLDIILIAASWYAALWLRFDFSFTQIPGKNLAALNHSIWMIVAVTLVLYFLMRLYQFVWSFFSIHDALQVLYTYLFLLPFYVIWGFTLKEVPKSVIAIAYVLCLMTCLGLRVSYRCFRLLFLRYGSESRSKRQNRIMVIGAGAAGSTLIRELVHSSDSTGIPVCVIDDNRHKKGKKLNGIPIIGGREQIADAAERYAVDEIIFAIPSAPGTVKKRILEYCRDTKCQIKTVPGIYQLVNGEVHISQIRPVDIEDLLGRDPIKVNIDEIKALIAGQVVMVTGGGGSIGSELCRQIASCAPKQLVIVDIYENSVYDLQQELKRQYGDALDLRVRIGSVRSRERIDGIMEEYHPDIIYHAAAHKHVPLMEDSPLEAIKNNVFGTLNVAQSAAAHHVKRMLLISTDKAVNPTNIMGASKRLCEMIVQRQSRLSPNTQFMAVRFGNVLGSNGSVIPLFKKQIAAGGPVTVTHKEITRYFMTIPEAVSLVLEASYYAKGGEIFVLDMGKPVKIDDMARNLIRLSGYEPDVDMPVIYTGLRPGEKLYEELLMDEEGMQKTDNALIFIGNPIEMDDAQFEAQLTRLRQACQSEDPKIKTLVADIVPTYHPKAADL